MKKSILEIYGLAVCFFAVIMITVNAGMFIYDLIGVVNPELTMDSYKYEKHLSNENFKEKTSSREKDSDALSNLSEKELTKKRESSLKIELKTEARGKLQSIVQQFIFMFISSIVLLIHWKISTSARGKNI